jgi:hypothetical protein
MTTTLRQISLGLMAAAGWLLAGCTHVAPPYTINVARMPQVQPQRASSVGILLDTQLEATAGGGGANTGPDFTPPGFYQGFVEDLEAGLSARWPDVRFKVKLSTSRVPQLAGDVPFTHTAIMRLNGMVMSSRYGASGRNWNLLVMQRRAPDSPIFNGLMSAQFGANFAPCYVKQITISDNKVQCRTEIVTYIGDLLRQSEILP